MPRALRIILVGLGYLAFGAVGVVLAYILLPLRLLGVRGAEARILAAQDLLHKWTRRYFVFTRVLGIARATYLPPSTLPETAGAAMMIANHPSLLDVVFIMAAVPRVTYVAKEAWMRGPLVGRMLRACGHIPAPKGMTPADGAIALERMIDALRAGRSLLVFPEGTRSPKNEMWPFQRGAFEAAVRTGSPIVRYVLDVEPPTLRKNQPWYDVADRRIEFRMRTMPTIPADALGNNTKRLVAEVEAEYRDVLGLGPRAPVAIEARAAVEVHP